MLTDCTLRPLDRQSDREITLVAERMRLTLMEVLGAARGDAYYTMEWLVERVRWHLVPDRRAEVLVAEAEDKSIAGHTIVRVEVAGDGTEYGLFSTTYIDPAARRHGLAKALLHCGEAWMSKQGLSRAVTYTSATNHKLIKLYADLGYTLRSGLVADDGSAMVELSRALLR